MSGMQVSNTMVQLMTERETLRAEVERQDREIERLRAALRFYADADYNGHNGGPECARAALEVKE